MRSPTPSSISTTCPASRGRWCTGNGHPPLALSNSFAFGGHNVALALRGAPDERHRHALEDRVRPPAADPAASAWRRSATPARCACCARGAISARLGERAVGRRRRRRRHRRRSTAGRSPATRRTARFLGGSLGERTPTRSCACCRPPSGRGSPSSGSSSPAAPACRRAPRRWPATGRSSARPCASPAWSRRSRSSPARRPAAAPTRRRSPT